MTRLDNGWIGDNWWGWDDGGTPERALPPRYEEPPGLGDGDDTDEQEVTDDDDDNGTAETGTD